MTWPDKLSVGREDEIEFEGAIQVGPVETWAVVPVKQLGQAKSRLRGRLNQAERAALMVNLLRHTLQVLGKIVSSGSLAGVIVLSEDKQLLALAESLGVRTVSESGLNLAPEQERPENLNAVLTALVQYLALHAPDLGGKALLILPADLPLLTEQDLAGLLSLSAATGAVLVPDHARQGTNSLWLPLKTALEFPFNFGDNSFALHQEILRRHRVSFEIYEQPGLLYDLDYPTDFERLPPGLQKSLTDL